VWGTRTGVNLLSTSGRARPVTGFARPLTFMGVQERNATKATNRAPVFPKETARPVALLCRASILSFSTIAADAGNRSRGAGPRFRSARRDENNADQPKSGPVPGRPVNGYPTQAMVPLRRTIRGICRLFNRPAGSWAAQDSRRKTLIGARERDTPRVIAENRPQRRPVARASYGPQKRAPDFAGP